MKRHIFLVGLAGTMLVAGFAGGALSQASTSGKYYPDGTNCSLLSDQELVACQNQIYARQLRSGESEMATGAGDQTVVPGSNPAGAAESAGTFVLGAETDPPPALPRPETGPTMLGGPTVLPGPEGTMSASPQ